MAVRVLDCAWTDRFRFVRSMLGWPFETTVGSVSLISRNTPAEHPEYKWMHAVSAEQVPVVLGRPDNNDAQTMIKYGDGNARYRVTYKALDYNVREDDQSQTNELYRFITRDRETNVESLVTRGQFKWASDGVRILEPLSVLQPTATWRYTWHQIPAGSDNLLPSGLRANIDAALGTTNSAAFDSSRFSTEQLLLVGANEKRYYTQGGDLVYDVTYVFMFRYNTWRKLFRPSAEAWREVVTSGASAGGTSLYTTSDYTKLFRLSA